MPDNVDYERDPDVLHDHTLLKLSETATDFGLYLSHDQLEILTAAAVLATNEWMSGVEGE
jgi:hypothetical protein